jgi:hypothetical protein
MKSWILSLCDYGSYTGSYLLTYSGEKTTFARQRVAPGRVFLVLLLRHHQRAAEGAPLTPTIRLVIFISVGVVRACLAWLQAVMTREFQL